MHDGVTTSWARIYDGLRNHADYGDARRAELLPLLVQEERQLDAWADDGGMVATPSKPAATLDLPVLWQMRLL